MLLQLLHSNSESCPMGRHFVGKICCSDGPAHRSQQEFCIVNVYNSTIKCSSIVGLQCQACVRGGLE